MVDWDLVVGFDWDAGNARKSVVKHDVTQAETEQLFLNEPLLVLVDQGHSATEKRWHALGRTDDRRRLHVTFTLRNGGTRILVISARDISRKERVVYEQQP